MIALSIIGAVILAFFLLVSSFVNKGEEDAAVTPWQVAGLVLIIALSGFLIAAGIFN